MTKLNSGSSGSLNDASPGEWSMAHQRDLDSRVAEYAAKIADDTSALDVQVGGGHYKDMAIQPIEFITANELGFCEGNVIKYVCRYSTKGGVQDIDKAIHYLEMLKESLY